MKKTEAGKLQPEKRASGIQIQRVEFLCEFLTTPSNSHSGLRLPTYGNTTLFGLKYIYLKFFLL